MRALSEVIQAFSTDPEKGLSSQDVAASRQRFGANRLTPLPREPIWKKFLEKFDEPIIKILLAAALLSMFVELFQGNPLAAGIALVVVVAAVVAFFVMKLGDWIPSLLFASALIMFFVGWIVPPHHPSVEGLAVMIAVILATGVAFFSEYKSDQEFEKLNTQKETIRVKVNRDGQFHTIPLEEVVVGDVVDLETGDEIPADGRLYKALELEVDQSLMTGESLPVPKRPQPGSMAEGPDQLDCLYRGTQIVDGAAVMIVAAVGDETMLGQIARKLGGEGEEDEEDEANTEETRVKHKLTMSKAQTPLQVKLTNLAGLISYVGYVAAIAIFVVLVIRGLIIGELNPATLSLRTGVEQGWVGVAGQVLNYFVYMVIIIVVAVPEGLPMSVTVSLAMAMRKMTRANSLVRQLVACETIGSATVICSDKTGTLTQNKMQVVRLFLGGSGADRGSAGWKMPDASSPWPRSAPIDWLALNAAVNSTAHLEEKEGKTITVGNSTEGALLQWLREAKLDYVKLRAAHEPLCQFHFTSENKRMTTVIEYGGRLVAMMKGAPEILIGFTTHYEAADGSVQPWTDATRQAVMDYLRDSARQAMRTLAFARKELPADYPKREEELHAKRDAIEAGMIFVGLVAIRDPLRDDVKDAVDRCHIAGIEVKMITGDNVETARAIARDIGLVADLEAAIDTDDAVILTSPKFNADYDQLKQLEASNSPNAETVRRRLTNLRVLARARPLDKYKMVELLQQQQHVVAMTGDGTNDAASLKKADVGLAMGIAGTEVAKEASKIVLLDDAFSTIVKAVQWGRSLYENIQRFIQFQLTINVSALTIAFLGPFFGVKPPFTVLQLLWINVIMDTFAAIALCSEPPREGVMLMKPKKKDENILTPGMIRTILGTAVFFVVVMLTLLIGMKGSLYGLTWEPWFAGKGEVSDEFGPLTTRQVSIFFAVYVFFQVWNQINCRSLVPSESGFARLFTNPTFLLIAGTVAVVQVALTQTPFLSGIFKVEPLGLMEWLVIIASTASVLVFAEVWRRIRLAMKSA